jgi:hypothetical protein
MSDVILWNEFEFTLLYFIAADDVPRLCTGCEVTQADVTFLARVISTIDSHYSPLDS